MWNRFDHDDLLRHPVRQAILDLARKEPGLPYLGLHERLLSVSGRSSLGYGSLSHHLYKLERAGLLTSRRSGRCRRYYERGSALGDPTALSILQRPRTLAIARVIAERGSITQRELARSSGISGSRQVIGYHVRLLEGAGLVALRQEDSGIRIEPTERLHRTLAWVRDSSQDTEATA